MKKIIILMSLFLLLSCSCKFSPQEDEYTPYEKIDISSIVINEEDPDYIFLKNDVEYFAYDATGYAREERSGLDAFDRIFEKENALDYFYKLEAEAKNEGKLYALCGLYYFDYLYYVYLMEEYVSSDETVAYGEGCIRTIEKISYLIKKDDNEIGSVVRLKNNGDTCWDWRERNPTVTTFELDFYGGGIPDSAKRGPTKPD